MKLDVQDIATEVIAMYDKSSKLWSECRMNGFDEIAKKLSTVRNLLTDIYEILDKSQNVQSSRKPIKSSYNSWEDFYDKGCKLGLNDYMNALDELHDKYGSFKDAPKDKLSDLIQKIPEDSEERHNFIDDMYDYFDFSAILSSKKKSNKQKHPYEVAKDNGADITCSRKSIKSAKNFAEKTPYDIVLDNGKQIHKGTVFNVDYDRNEQGEYVLGISVDGLGKTQLKFDSENDAFKQGWIIESSNKSIKSGNIYDFNNCSWCGDEASGTLESFLKRDGYDVEVACEILDADPAEVVCEDCYKSIKPQLDAKMYSEYDDLGTDIRTGEPFQYPVRNGFDRNTESLNKIFNRRY